MTMDVISVGRVSVDLYAREPNVGFEKQQSFMKSIGGSPTNLAVAVARLGHKVALATKVGDDAFGEYVRFRLEEFGVSTELLKVQPKSQTPLAFAALTPPESPTVVFYRGKEAPDTTLLPNDVSDELVKATRILWISQSGLAQGTTAQSSLEWMAKRSRDQLTILDLDYRPSLWNSVEDSRKMAQKAIALASVVVGNREECLMALGTDEPNAAADALLDAGVTLAIVKLGADGALFATAEQRIQIAPIPIDVVCGLGAGDAFGGALCHGLLEGWTLENIGLAANAAGALVSLALTCSDAMPTSQELSEMMERQS
jgi:5-dehydro-2-deoxygluconokinase